MRFTIVTANSSYLLERHRGRHRYTVLWLEAVLSQGGEFAFVLLATDAIQGVIGGPWQNLLAFAVTLSIAARRLGKVERQALEWAKY
jgi:hypothetical protein